MDVYGVPQHGTIWADDLRIGCLRHKLIPSARPAWEVPEELRELRGEELLDAIRHRPEPFFIKTHRLVDAQTDDLALYVVRDGRDSLVSHAVWVKEQKIPRFEGLSFNERLAHLIHPGVRSYGTWSESVMTWTKRDAPVSLIRFEDLVEDAPAAVSRACGEVGVELPPATGQMLDFDYLREVVPKVFRKGKIGSWRDEMPDHLQERFIRIHGPAMRELGYLSAGTFRDAIRLGRNRRRSRFHLGFSN